MTPINNMQKAIIKIAQKQLGLDDDAYRSMLRQLFDVATCKDLDFNQADTLIKEFEKMGFVRTGGPARRQKWNNSMRRPKAPNMIDLASPQILDMINRLSMDIQWRIRDGFFPWMKSKFGITHIRTMAEAIKVLEGLKAMKRWQQKQGAPVVSAAVTALPVERQGEPF
jgi:hypothetical protein